MRLKGLSLIEIIVSMVILSLVLAGMANVFVVGKSYMKHNQLRIDAVESAKQIIDPLYAQVRADTDENLEPGEHTLAPITIRGVTYAANYTVTDVAGTDLRRVTVKVTWEE